MSGEGYNPAMQLVLDVLDRMIDEGIKNTERLTELKLTVSQSKDDINRFLDRLENELKKELRDHVSTESDRVVAAVRSEVGLVRKEIEPLQALIRDSKPFLNEHENFKLTRENTDKLIAKVDSPATYLKLFMAFLVAVVTFVSAAGTLVWRMTSWLENDTPSMTQPQIQNQQRNTISQPKL